MEMNSKHLLEIRKLVLSTEEKETLRAKQLATDKARAAQVLSAIQFRLGTMVTDVTEVIKKR